MWLLCVAFFVAQHGCGANVAVPRGVSFAKASLYTISDSNQFTCLDGSETISFDLINDDYCDCDDGSDEPGTSACTEGRFYCPNIGHTGTEISSAWVNDGVCDCCDGSDEYATTRCTNTCDELGATVRLRQHQLNEMRQRGYQLKLELLEQGKVTTEQQQIRAKELETELESAEAAERQLETDKVAAEEVETQLLEVYREEERLLNEQREADDKQRAQDVFTALDTDADDSLSTEELLQEMRFDTNGDGTVTKDEVDVFTLNVQQMSRDDYLTSMWPLIKPLFADPTDADSTAAPPSAVTPPDVQNTLWRSSPESTPAPAVKPLAAFPSNADSVDGLQDREDADDGDDLGEDDYDDDDNDDRDEADDGGVEKPSEYDAETQAAVDAAKRARQDHSEAVRHTGDVRKQLEDVQGFLSMELGPQRVYAAMHKQCYLHVTHEYEYALCMFDKATQKPKIGGIETTLGRWGSWLQVDGAQHKQLYDNGQQCWNGPKRTATIVIECGEESRLTAVTEPSKCEYQLTFVTPAACDQLQPATENIHHEEL